MKACQLSMVGRCGNKDVEYGNIQKTEGKNGHYSF